MKRNDKTILLTHELCWLLVVVFLTYPNNMFSILLNQARPPASHRLLREQRGSLWRFGLAWAFHARYHLQAALLWAFSWRNQMQQIQLHCACGRVMDMSFVFFQRVCIVWVSCRSRAALSHLGSRPRRICHCPISGCSTSEGSWIRFCPDSKNGSGKTNHQHLAVVLRSRLHLKHG